jgi:hypothetical protein
VTSDRDLLIFILSFVVGFCVMLVVVSMTLEEIKWWLTESYTVPWLLGLAFGYLYVWLCWD